MARVVLASGVARWIRPSAGEIAFDVEGGTVRAALEHVFVRHPDLRGYVLDDHGRVRRHVTIFVDGDSIAGKPLVDVALRPQTEIVVMGSGKPAD